jgi:FAR-17a/AIG1-like protein.
VFIKIFQTGINVAVDSNSSVVSCYIIFLSVFLSQLVTVNYWSVMSLLTPNLIDDTRVFHEHVPWWMDHTLHTTVIFLALAELLLCYRPYPRSPAIGRLRSTVVVLGYTSW